MITAVESSVILDVLTGDRGNASASLAALRKASWGLEFMPSTLRSSIHAGEMLRQMLTRKKRQEGRILPDFLRIPPPR